MGFLDRLLGGGGPKRSAKGAMSPLDTASAPPFSSPVMATQSFDFRRGLNRDVTGAQVSYREWQDTRAWGYEHLGTACRQMSFQMAPSPGETTTLLLHITLTPFRAPGRFHLPSFGNEVRLFELDTAGQTLCQWECRNSYGSITVEPDGMHGSFDRLRFYAVGSAGDTVWLRGSWSISS